MEHHTRSSLKCEAVALGPEGVRIWRETDDPITAGNVRALG
jgi:hypothetical protein